jgi:hypothetical protein
MKRLRKFNESVSQIDYDYVYSCFAELIDDNKVEIELVFQKWKITVTGEYVKVSYITIRLKTQPKEDPRITNQAKPIKDKKSTIYNYIIGHNSNNELLKELEVSLNRLSDKYPDYKLQFTDYGNSIFMEIFENKEEEQYPF